MSTINPNLSIPELIKLIKHAFRECDFDEVQNILMEREKNMKIEMEKLVRECDSLAKTQSYTELEKCSLEEKLGRSQRRCEEWDKRVQKLKGEKLDLEKKLERSHRKCEELRRDKYDANQTVEELQQKVVEAYRVVQKQQLPNVETQTVDEFRAKNMESDKTAELYKSRLDDLEPRMLKVEATLAKVLNANPANLVGAMDKSAAPATDVNLLDFVENGKVDAAAGDGDSTSPQIRVISDNYGGSGGYGLSKKGGRSLAHSGTNRPHTYPGSKPAYNSAAPESKGTVQDDEGKKAVVRGARHKVLLSRRCDLDIINKIKNNLDKENLKIFGQSCFGHLLKINELKFQGQLILQLLLHMDMGDSNEERLVFKINDSNMEFGPSDFFLITGLRLGTSEATTASSSILECVFQGRSRITVKDVEEAFLTISRDHEGRGELTLKLALLYFLYGNLFIRDRCSTKIDLQYFHLIEDLQKFNAFPWGRVAYQFLVSSIHSVRVRIHGSKVTRQRVLRIDVYGFIYALQAWAYEMMPSVATYCASRANNFENLTTRILRWSATKIVQFNDLKKFFTPGDKARLKKTMVKWEELSTDTIPQVAIWPHQKKRKLLSDKDQMHHAQPTSELSSAAAPTMPPPPSANAPTSPPHHLTHEKSDDNGIIKRRLSRDEDMLESILGKFDQPIPDKNCDDLPRNQSSPQVEDEEAVKKAEQPASATTLTRHSTSGPNPISMNDATDKSANLEGSSAEIEQVRAPFELAFENPALHKPQLFWKVYVRRARMVKSGLEGKCSSSAPGDGIAICNHDVEIPDTSTRNITEFGDDSPVHRTRKKKISKPSAAEERGAAAAADSQSPVEEYSTDSDDESCSDDYMNNLVALLRTKMSTRLMQ